MNAFLVLFIMLAVGPGVTQFRVAIPVESVEWCHAYLATPDEFVTPRGVKMQAGCADSDGNLVPPPQERPA